MPSQGQGYALIGIDQMEAAVVRRRLMNLQKQGVMELVSQLQRNDLLSDAKIRDPRYETNVWPLEPFAKFAVEHDILLANVMFCP